MEKQIITEEFKNCPKVYYYPDANKLEITGRSIPENPEQIFKRIEEWIDLHFETNTALDVSIQLDYINSGSSKHLFEILKQLTIYIKLGKSIEIKWLYEEDEDSMLDLGEHYRDSVGAPIIIEVVE